MARSVCVGTGHLVTQLKWQTLNGDLIRGAHQDSDETFRSLCVSTRDSSKVR